MKKWTTMMVIFLLSFSLNLGFVYADPCPGATVPGQCGFFPADTVPPFVGETMTVQGAPPSACGHVVVLSSGLPGDPDFDLDTDMGNPGCGVNPDGFPTLDCNILPGYVPPVDSIVLSVSSEYAEFLGSPFTDWMEIGGLVSVSIDDWVGDPSLALMPAFGPTESGSVTLATLAAGAPVDLKVADSEDPFLDSALIVVPVDCFEELGEVLLCGNGDLDPGEECDDENTDDGDGCSSICLLEPACGDGEINQDFEKCDDGNREDGDGCSSDCGIEEPECGDGRINQPEEECDDDNTESGDGCSSECLIEEEEPFCGDGDVNQITEQCDDGNHDDGDGCSSECLIEEEEAFCGDGAVNQPFEQCDDGNHVDGDGCSSECEKEDAPEDIPEFTTLGALAALGGVGIYLYRKRRD